jgi:carboxylesterase type B
MRDLIVETTGGKLRGERRGGVAIWKGIPYATPPLGAPRQPRRRRPGRRSARRVARGLAGLSRPRAHRSTVTWTGAVQALSSAV